MDEHACDLVLVACDFSSGSCAAAHSAARDATDSGTRLLLVHVVSEDAEVDLPPRRVVAGAARVHRAAPFDGGVALRLAACVTVPVVLVAPEAEVREGAER